MSLFPFKSQIKNHQWTHWVSNSKNIGNNKWATKFCAPKKNCLCVRARVRYNNFFSVVIKESKFPFGRAIWFYFHWSCFSLKISYSCLLFHSISVTVFSFLFAALYQPLLLISPTSFIFILLLVYRLVFSLHLTAVW